MTEEKELDTTVEEWKNAIEEMCYPNDPGITCNELQEKLNINRYVAKLIIKKKTKEGKCICGKNTRLDALGRRQVVPVYQLITKGAK